MAVLVPAHNEELQISDTVRNIQEQLRNGDRLVVVADNCNDMTSMNARDAGAEVVERFDALHRGKGYALDAGVRYLAEAPPEIVVIVDADCWLEPGALDELTRMCAATNRPLQSRYLMIAPPVAAINLAVSEFAFLLKNRIRLLGLTRLGLPVQLTGSGMAFPWSVIREAELAHGNLVEDMKLGLDLARAGHAPLFCDTAVIRSRFPYSIKGLGTQVSRWDAGRLRLMRSLLSALLDTGTFRNSGYLALVLDALVPPLTLLAALLFAMLLLTGILAATEAAMVPFLVSTLSVTLFGTALANAWWVHGKRVLPPHALIELPKYAIGKIKRYPGYMLNSRRSVWIRTDRDRPTET
ncbi:glycosyltransferase family 2 protein [Rhizobium terrae]|uniref:glycosyltransferase family 2 protein n=1 Tax=Rhizobium terrae TaxID=2171756 RepID=UPI0013C2FBAA|nr:glycosyltransferase family 2 protein [Rhizobium terrae]